MNRILLTEGKGSFTEKEYNLSPLRPDEISVQSCMTGVCRSDIDMMEGRFGPLPIHMQGHEGLGKVIDVGSEITNVCIGDFVATRGEPAYADTYHVRKNEYVQVPAADPKYIIEPVACGINIVEQSILDIRKREGENKKLLILGSGFLAWVAYHTLKLNHLKFNIDVVGSSNKEIWSNHTELLNQPEGKYNVIIDLSNRSTVFDCDILEEEALIVFGAQKTITTDFQNLLWKSCSMIFPSPRYKNFHQSMKDAVFYIRTGALNVDIFWTKGYNRDTEWQQAFEDGVKRPANYNRGFIYWNNYDH
jgi:hypothetical protein